MKTLKTWRIEFALLWVAALLVGCGGGGIVKPQNFEQQLAYGYGTHTAIMQTAANGVETGALSADEGMQVLRLADESKLLLDSAKLAIGVGDLATAQGQLALATNVLTQLQVYLNSKSKVKP